MQTYVYMYVCMYTYTCMYTYIDIVLSRSPIACKRVVHYITHTKDIKPALRTYSPAATKQTCVGHVHKLPHSSIQTLPYATISMCWQRWVLACLQHVPLALHM